MLNVQNASEFGKTSFNVTLKQECYQVSCETVGRVSMFVFHLRVDPYKVNPFEAIICRRVFRKIRKNKICVPRTENMVHMCYGKTS